MGGRDSLIAGTESSAVTKLASVGAITLGCVLIGSSATDCGCRGEGLNIHGFFHSCKAVTD